jgi:oxygen-independent coproporphyrinogen III oxidase
LSHDLLKSGTEKGISLYLHLPFCESLCTYCGCNKKISRDHSVEDTYIAAIHKEWGLYMAGMSERPVIRELHLGGGTPTFFSPDNLRKLLEPILASGDTHPDHEFSFEGHPNNTTEEHLRTLYDLGFRRVSYGVQDNDPDVQRIINRIQPLANVEKALNTARSVGYLSVNFDLIYGLPLQTTSSIARTIKEVIALRPDRIAFYSYAHVPWTSRGQRLFEESDLPDAAAKQAMYLSGKQLLLAAGYHDIGMDHFALPDDDMYIARKEGRLHRNFMGYTTQNTDILIGLGVSAISATPGAFAQNEKTLHNYYALIDSGHTAVQKGYFLSDQDRHFGNYIMNISCNGYTRFREEDLPVIMEVCLPYLQQLQDDDLILFDDNGLMVTTTGKNYIRNICSAFDLYLIQSRIDKEKRVFSHAI